MAISEFNRATRETLAQKGQINEPKKIDDLISTFGKVWDDLRNEFGWGKEPMRKRLVLEKERILKEIIEQYKLLSPEKQIAVKQKMRGEFGVYLP